MTTSREYFLKIISPSILSSFVAIFVSVMFVVIVLTPFLYRGSYFEQYAQTLQDYPGGWSEAYSNISNQLNSSAVVGNISVFCIYAIIGFAVYSLVLGLLSFFIDLNAFSETMKYTGTDKHSFLRIVAERLLIRIAALVALSVFVAFLFTVLLPAALTMITAAFAAPRLLGAFYIITSIVFLSAAMHVIVLLLRLLALRLRLVSWLYTSIE